MGRPVGRDRHGRLTQRNRYGSAFNDEEHIAWASSSGRTK